MQETGFSQQLQVGPENQVSLQGKHDTDSQSQIQNSAPLPMFSPARLICLKHNCRLIKGFLSQVIWYDRDEQWEDHPDSVTPVPEKNQKQVCFTFWTQNFLSFLPTCFHINHIQKPPPAAEVAQICTCKYLIIKNSALTLRKIAVIFEFALSCGSLSLA